MADITGFRYQICQVHRGEETYYMIEVVHTNEEGEIEAFSGCSGIYEYEEFDTPEEAIRFVKDQIRADLDMLADISHYPVLKTPF